MPSLRKKPTKRQKTKPAGINATVAQNAETPHPGLVPGLGAYHETFNKLLGLEGEFAFTDGDPFANATIGEMFSWYLGGCHSANDIWAPLRDQAQAIRDLVRSFDEYHTDLPMDFCLSGEWTERADDIARRLEVLAWLHHRVVQEIRMQAVHAKQAEVRS